MSAITKLLSRSVMIVPRPVRRYLSDRPWVQGLLARALGRGRATCMTPDGTTLVVNPLYHAQFLAGGIDGYEPSVRRALREVCRPGSVFFDVGANVGVFSSLAASLVGDSGRVVAFEPERNNLRCLEETIRKNGFRNLSLVPKAVGRDSGTSEFDRRGGAFSGRLVDHGRYGTTGNRTEVETISLDDHVRRTGGPVPDAVKIDVEGNELLVLQGMRGLLESAAPTIICEVHTHLGDSPQEVADFLEARGYELVDLEDFVGGKRTPLADITTCDCFVATRGAKGAG